jgi:hypothetical protein
VTVPEVIPPKPSAYGDHPALDTKHRRTLDITACRPGHSRAALTVLSSRIHKLFLGVRQGQHSVDVHDHPAALRDHGSAVT